ncbi:MAG: glycosyltransferase [Planctomycetota bacterium]|nr:glycosyltransferase [Planctomycetota bacterium]
MSDVSNSDAKRFSVALIVRDAESLLGPTLQSVAAIADEIVVADTGSRDNTREIAKQWATRVLDVPWQDSFAAARNACMHATTGDWILWLDAGETISETTALALRGFVDEQADERLLYKLFVQLAPHKGSFADQKMAQTRLIPGRRPLCFEGRVRERIVSTVGNASPAVEILDWQIRRATFHDEPAAKTRRGQRNLKLADLEISENGATPQILLVRAEALAQLGEIEEARKWFLRARHDAKPGSDDLLESYYGELTSFDEDEPNREVQLALCIEALEVFPTDLQLLCAMGGYLQAQDKIELAARAYKTAVEHGQANPNVWYLGDIHDIAAICLSVVYQLQGKDGEALTLLQNELHQRPASLRLRYQMFDFQIRHGRQEEAIKSLDGMPADMPQREALVNAVRGACLASNGDWAAAQGYLETAYQAGCRDAICLRWLAATWIALEKPADTGELLDEWRQLEPDNDEINQFLDSLAKSKLTSGTVGTLGGREIRLDPPNDGPAEATETTQQQSIKPRRRRYLDLR